MKYTKEIISQTIKRLRIKTGITAQELSNVTGIQNAIISRIENGKMMGTVETHAKIAEAFNMSLSELFAEIESDGGIKKQSLDRSKRELKLLVDDLKKVADKISKRLKKG